MEFKPWAYQAFAIDKIIEQPEAGLFLSMGLGKTIITLTAIEELLYDRFEIVKVLVIAPLRVAQTVWSDEITKWNHLRHLRLVKVLGTARQRREALQTYADIYIINRENVPWLVQECGDAWPFDMVVIDELSSFKSNNAQRFKALKRVRPYIRRMVGLTGTPAPNSLLDLWPQIYLLDQGQRLGKTVTGYRERYFRPGRRNRTVIFNWDPKPGAEEAIYKTLEDLCVSMSAEDWLDMPERLDRIVKVRLTDQAREDYQTLQRQLVLELDKGSVTANDAGVLANKLLQMANGAVYDEDGQAIEIHTAKLDALEELIEAANGQPVLVFYSYKHDLARIKKRTKVRELKTERDIEDWNAGRIPVLLAHPGSAGHGLNLQDGGHIIIWFGLPWSLEMYQQANARLHRQGQQQSVIIHHLVAEGTIDERVMQVLEDKAAGQDDLLAAVKALIEEVDEHEAGFTRGRLAGEVRLDPAQPAKKII